MCILFLSIAEHPQYPLIIAANRDEYFDRPSQSMHFWSDKPHILAGRDLTANGTWLGVNRYGQFAAVTNYRGEISQSAQPLSRGGLVTQFLDGSPTGSDLSAFCDYLHSHHHQYNPFNLVFGDMNQVWAWDHHRKIASKLSTGFHSISNGPIENKWPKMLFGEQHLAKAVSAENNISLSNLLNMMQNKETAAEVSLPNTGFDLQHEKALSSIFIEGQDYGTRTTTLLLFTGKQIQIAEVNYDRFSTTQSNQQFLLEPIIKS